MSVFLAVDTNVFLITEAAQPQVRTRKRLFLICDDCFWVASAIAARYSDPVECPTCGRALSSLPISVDEEYTYSHATIPGLDLPFCSQGIRRKYP
jgi:hypothetical protein